VSGEGKVGFVDICLAKSATVIPRLAESKAANQSSPLHSVSRSAVRTRPDTSV